MYHFVDNGATTHSGPQKQVAESQPLPGVRQPSLRVDAPSGNIPRIFAQYLQDPAAVGRESADEAHPCRLANQHTQQVQYGPRNDLYLRQHPRPVPHETPSHQTATAAARSHGHVNREQVPRNQPAACRGLRVHD